MTAETHPPQINPALADLAVFVGQWRMELSRASFLPDPEATLTGTTVIEWVEDGAFLVMRQGERRASPHATWLFGRDDAGETYQVLYADDRGVSRIYAMSFADGVWRLWRAAPGFHQRFTGTFSPDGRRIDGAWEKSADGQTWEHDFNLTYIKTDPT